MNRERIEETVRLWQAEPDKAKGKPTVIARAEGSKAVMEHGSFSWHTDMPVPLGGTNEAPSPTALLLSALAGCAVVFIRDTLAPQLEVTVDAIEATAQCETDARGLLGMDGVAPDVRNVGLTIAIRSPEDENAVRRVYQAWQERCPVYLALGHGTCKSQRPCSQVIGIVIHVVTVARGPAMASAVVRYDAIAVLEHEGQPSCVLAGSPYRLGLVLLRVKDG